MKKILAGVAIVSALMIACSSGFGDPGAAEETGDVSAELSGGVPIGTALVTTANLNLRAGPSLSDHIERVIPQSSEVKTINRTTAVNGFFNVEYNGVHGWSYGAYLAKMNNGGGGGGGSSNAVVRALEWVNAGVPYCGGVNGGHDYICGGTCYRAHAAWDAWRSDCSGLVSWAWQLPAPGRITTEFAPYDNTVSYEINAVDLAPGDAVNNSHHVMLFWHWVNKGAGEAAFIEESDCGLKALTRTFHFSMYGSTIDLGNGYTFHAIRHR